MRRPTPDAGYLYSLAVHPRARGQAIGTVLLGWAEAHVRRRDRAYLRLDCMASNERLRRYYETHGFCFSGEVSAGGFSGALYEKQL